MLYIDDLESLEDISDDLVFEDEPNIFSEEHAIELVETAFHLMEEYMAEHPTAISEPDFHDTLLEEVKEMFYIQMEDHILESDYIEDDMNDLLEDAFQIYISTFHPERSVQPSEHNDLIPEDAETDLIAQKIQKLRESPQPAQRTREWYEFRWTLISASDIWKVFESQATVNQLIYAKCQPLKYADEDVNEPVKLVNTNTTLHWGQKYEPLSGMFYEHLYNAQIEEFGCIRHPTYSFIGASPDGIVTQGRHGRMLEIKNIVNREITGIPKKEYWIQMQIQMEVCDLDECDFLETKFTEYPDYQAYRDDSTIGKLNDTEFQSYTTTQKGDYKGIIIQFFTREGAPYYAYMPLHIWKPDDIVAWEHDTIQHYESKPYEYTFIKFIYWKLEKMSCVLVTRNREWFKNNVGQIEKVWRTVEHERVAGYEHRAPVKRPKKEHIVDASTNTNDTFFLNIVKLN